MEPGSSTLTRQTRSGATFSPWRGDDAMEPGNSTSTRQTRSGATFSPYLAPASLSRQLVRVSLESGAAFRDAATRESQLDHTGAPPKCRSPSPTPLPVASHGHPAELNGVYVEIAGTPPPSASTTSSNVPPAAASASKNAGRKRRRSERRKAAAAARADSPVWIRPVKASTARKYRNPSTLSTPIRLDDLPHAAGGSWVGLRKGVPRPSATTPGLDSKKWRKEVPTLAELMETGRFQYVAYKAGKNLFVVDDQDRVMASLLDKPTSVDWLDTCAEASRCLGAVEDIGLEVGAFGAADMHTRRGHFLQVPVGPSMGGGQQHPTNLYSSNARRHQVNQSILQNEAIQRVAGVQSSAFAFTSPLLYAHYCQELSPIFEHDPDLIQNFSNSVFPAASFNCGNQSTSLAHFDFNNLSFGQCALTAFGDFDHRLGGHIVIYSLGLIIEFPAGTTFTLPSAAYEHGNTQVMPGQTRRSMAQYAAGALFRWKAYGFRTANTLSKTAAGRAHLQAVNKDTDERWKEGLELYSSLGSLESDYTTLAKLRTS